ncbi:MULTISPECIES: preprotein translocase subunit SecE [Lactococcus]|uniref:Preprotein translocase subunit SecE n=1 Tax=Lactococcus lactis subsp. cremoris TaxID=1359 RepID=A0A161U303_LACLC|nr:preprotein translocase subunit SecE [Lactococcus cremoris]KZK08520.1 hypothetical protein AB996_0128 [Lactococcus cremoris]
MRMYSKNIEKELKKITWLSIPQILKETATVIIISIVLLIFLGGINWLLQQSFIHLMR